MKIIKAIKGFFSDASVRKKTNIFIYILPVILIFALLIVNIIYNTRNYSTEFYRATSNKTVNKLRIVFLTDLHLREYGDGNASLIADIESLSPDVIILGGDFVTDKKEHYENMTELFGKLTEISSVYGVWGNHEDVKMYIQKDGEMKKQFESTGVRFLTNEAVEAQINGNNLVICGIDGAPSNFDKYGAKAVMESFDQMQGFKICVAHVPTYFSEKLADYDFDLGLSGHTHGGIIRIPKLGPLYSAEEGLFPEFAGGMYTLSNGANLITSRGLGHSGLVPRINNIPELSVIDIS